MALVRVRRDGNSLAVTIPTDEVRKAQLKEGEYVNVQADEATGCVVIEPVSVQRRPYVRPEVLAAGRKVIEEDHALLERLAAYDRGEAVGEG